MDKTKLTKALKTLNLSESSINEIHSFIETQIKENVNSEIKNLTAKVFGFLKQTRDSIRESVIKEMEESDSTYRNSQIMEELKALMGLEFNKETELKINSDVSKENSELTEELKLLNSTMETLMEENEKLKSTLKVVHKNAKTLAESNKVLGKKVGRLEESSKRPFKSSEKALALSHSEKAIDTEDDSEVNEFINEDIQRLAN